MEIIKTKGQNLQTECPKTDQSEFRIHQCFKNYLQKQTHTKYPTQSDLAFKSQAHCLWRETLGRLRAGDGAEATGAPPLSFVSKGQSDVARARRSSASSSPPGKSAATSGSGVSSQLPPKPLPAQSSLVTEAGSWGLVLRARTKGLGCCCFFFSILRS